MDPHNLPQVIGLCAHCGLPLYESAPLAKPTVQIPLAHVACVVHASRVA